MTGFNKYKLYDIQNEAEMEYKSLKEIAKDLNIEYFMIRSLYHHSVKPKKYLHSHQKSLSEKYKIVNLT